MGTKTGMEMEMGIKMDTEMGIKTDMDTGMAAISP